MSIGSSYGVKRPTRVAFPDYNELDCAFTTGKVGRRDHVTAIKNTNPDTDAPPTLPMRKKSRSDNLSSGLSEALLAMETNFGSVKERKNFSWHNEKFDRNDTILTGSGYSSFALGSTKRQLESSSLCGSEMARSTTETSTLRKHPMVSRNSIRKPKKSISAKMPNRLCRDHLRVSSSRSTDAKRINHAVEDDDESYLPSILLGQNRSHSDSTAELKLGRRLAANTVDKKRGLTRKQSPDGTDEFGLLGPLSRDRAVKKKGTASTRRSSFVTDGLTVKATAAKTPNGASSATKSTRKDYSDSQM